MIANLLFIFSISSGSALAAVLWEKKFEDVLPITITSIIIFLFLGGLIGYLEESFWLTFGITAFLWLITIFLSVKKQIVGNVLKLFLNDGFWTFLFVYVGLNFVLYGMKLHEWDEFSHWGTVVKVMVQTNALGTSSQAHLTYGSYPPGMALFQYYLQKINLIIGSNDFSEWHLYLAYKVCGFSFVLPLIKGIGVKSFKSKLTNTLIFLLITIPFYTNYYHSLYIDAFLGLLFGIGLSMVVINADNQKEWHIFYYASICILLVLSKNSGILFAVIIAIVYFFIYCKNSNNIKKLLFQKSILGISIISPKLLWSYHVRCSEIPLVHSAPIYLVDILNILIGKDTTYRTEVYDLFKVALFNNTKTTGNGNFAVGDLGFSISYFSLIIVFIVGIYLSWYIMRQKSAITASAIIIAGIGGFIGWLFFYMGLAITYLFEFTEELAIRLASYSRYTHTIYLGLFIFVISITLRSLYELYSERNISVISVCIFLLLTPMEDTIQLLFRDTVQSTLDSRKPYLELSEKLRNVTNKNDHIYFICQDERYWYSGAAYWQISFEVRPAIMDDGWMMSKESIGTYISDKSAEEWKQQLISDYDYVALYLLDEYFYNTFSELFLNSEDIQENSVYTVNKTTGLLELCQ